MEYTVKSGDTLSSIAEALLGDAARWPEIFALSGSVIGADPNQIAPGMVLTLPTGNEGDPSDGPTLTEEQETEGTATTQVTPVEEMFPDDPLTQALATQLIGHLTRLGLDDFTISKENIGALIQTFFKGEFADTENQTFTQEGLRAISFHFTFERDFEAAKAVGQIINPNAFDEINAANPLAGTDEFLEASAGTQTGGVTDLTPPPGPQVGKSLLNEGILRGGSVVRVQRLQQEDLYFAQYEYPPGSGEFVLFEFQSLEQVKQVLGDDFETAAGLNFHVENEAWLKDTNQTLVDSDAAIIGLAGTFTTFLEDLMFQTAVELGLNDPTAIGAYLADPEIQAIIALGTLSGITPEAMQAQIRGTSYYQNVLYPGISFLFASSVEPEKAWKAYQANVVGTLELLGIDRDEDGTYKQTVGQLLTGGVSDLEFQIMGPAFVRAQNSGEYAAILNQWIESQLGQTLDFDNLFNVFAGEMAPELEVVVEAANIQFAAEQQGVDVAEAQLLRIQQLTDLTPSQLQAAFNTVEQQVLALDDAILTGRFGINREELISAATGIAPESGRSIVEIQNLARKIAIEEGLQDDPKLQLFTGFNPRTGTPFKPGLNPLAPEGA